MKAKIIIFTVITLAIIGSAVFYVLNSTSPDIAPVSNSTETSSVSSSTPPVTTKPDASEDDTPVTKGSYVDYSANKVASTAGVKVLFFHAPWCPQCLALEADIKTTDLPDGVTIFKVDYDSNQSLRQKYEVTIQTTLVSIDDDGKLVKKYVAYNEPTFASVKANLLD